MDANDIHIFLSSRKQRMFDDFLLFVKLANEEGYKKSNLTPVTPTSLQDVY